MNTTFREGLKNNLLVIAGLLVAAVAYRMYLIPNQVVAGGFTGVGQLVNHLLGVSVGTVKNIRLDEDNMALVRMQLNRKVRLPKDSMASIKTQGIIGDKYIQITLGGDGDMYQPGETVVDTESTLDIESLVSKFAFGGVGGGSGAEAAPAR